METDLQLKIIILFKSTKIKSFILSAGEQKRLLSFASSC